MVEAIYVLSEDGKKVISAEQFKHKVKMKTKSTYNFRFPMILEAIGSHTVKLGRCTFYKEEDVQPVCDYIAKHGAKECSSNKRWYTVE